MLCLYQLEGWEGVGTETGQYIYIYSRRAAAGSARTKVTRCHMFLLFFFLLLLLLLLLLQVKYFKSKTSKNTVFSDMFMPLELYIDEKTLVFTTFVQHQGRKSSKNTAIYTVFSECVENTAFCDVFSTRGFKCTANTMVFFIFFTSSSQSKPTKNTGIYSVLTRQHAKKTTFSSSFPQIFSSCASIKNAPFLLHFCHRSSGLKKVLNRAKLLN